MGLELYKPGQGKYARSIAYVLTGAIVAFGGLRLFGTINRPGENVLVSDLPVIGSISIYAVIALAVVALGMFLVHLLLNRAGTVDLLIETEQELKKVSWPSRREVRNATMVVVLVTFTMATMLYGFDNLLQTLFRLVWT